MKLLASLTSPFARKVRIVLAEKHVECELEVVNPWEPVNPVIEHNPLSQVPTLVLDDGNNVFDSRVIVEYLDAISPAVKLLPEPGRQRMLVRRIEALADGVTEAAMKIFLERKRPAEKRDPDWVALQRAAIDRGLDALERELGDKEWFHGHGLSLADIAAACCLGYLNLRFEDEVEWRVGHPGLAQHMDKLMARPSFADTVPPKS
ncbi:MAG: glutathione S-transferase [Sulfuricellaceae bacterium]|jgi:glutathione S-transferase